MQSSFKTVDPARVRVAREASGLSKVQLADYLDVSPRSVNTFENQGAPVRHREALSAATGRPIGFFTGEPFEPIETDRVHFRAAKKVSKKVRAGSVSLGAIGLYLYAKLVEPYILPPVDVPTFDGVSPEVAAARVLTTWQLAEGPLPNMVQLFESRGVRVLSLPRSIQKLDAFGYWYAEGYPCIFVNTDKTAERVRFDLAHELGHLVMHARYSGYGRDLEKEADRFAAEFLMPARCIRRDMPAYAGVDDIVRLKRRYRVSAMAMNYRGGELGILKEWGQRQNYVELTKRGYRTGEPNGLALDRSRVLPFVVGAMRQDRRSVARLAADIGVTMQDFNGFTFGEVLASVPAGRRSQAAQNRRSPGVSRPNLQLLK